MAENIIATVGLRIDTKDLDNLNRKLDEVPGKARKVSTDSKRMGDDVDSAAKKGGSSLKNNLVANFKIAATAAAAVGTAVAAFVLKGINEIDDLAKAAQRLGIELNSLAALEFAGSFADASIEDISAGLRKLIEDAGNGGPKLAALGIEVNDINGNLKTADTLFREVADAFAKYQDGTDKTAAALRLFGEEGVKLVPLLNGGSEAIDDATRKTQDFGLAVSESTGQAAQDFGDNVNSIVQRSKGLGRQLAEDFLPTLNAIAPEIETIVGGLLTALGVIGKIFAALTNVASQIFTVLKLPVEQLSTIFIAGGDIFAAFIETLVRNAGLAGKAIAAAINPFSDESPDFFLNQIDFTEFQTRAVSAIAVVGSQFSENFDNAATRLTELQTAFKEILTGPVDSPRAADNRDPFPSSSDEDEEELTTTSRLLGLREAINAVGAKTKEDQRQESTFRNIMNGIEESITYQRQLQEDIANGQIRSQEELNRRLDLDRRIQELINQAKRENITLTDEQIAKIRELAEEEQRTRGDTDRTLNPVLSDLDQRLNEIGEGFGGILSNSITDALDTGRFSFKDFLKDIGDYLLQSGLRELMASIFSAGSDANGNATQSIFTAFISSFFASKGAAYDGGTRMFSDGGAFVGGTQFFSQGGVVSSRTPFHNSVMGEAGPEAIMPLKRTTDGKLGVIAMGANGGSQIINQYTMAGQLTIAVESSGDAQEDSETARAMDRMLNDKFKRFIQDQQRSGNQLSPKLESY